MEIDDIAQLNSCLPSPIEEQDRLTSGQVSSEISRPAICPAPYDLPDIDQFTSEGSKYSCVACAGSGLRHILSRLQDINEEYDYQWIYEQCKLIDGYPGLNGTSLKALMQVGKAIGFKTITGKFRKIKEYKKINNPNDQKQIETGIFLYHGLIAAVTLSNDGWRSETVRMPKSWENTGGHGILLKGYNANNYLGQDSMPSYHGGKDDFNLPKNYMINEAWGVTVDDDIVDTALLTGWIATDVPGTISGNTLIGRLNLRNGANGPVIKTLQIGTKFNIVCTLDGRTSGHTWEQIEVIN